MAAIWAPSLATLPICRPRSVPDGLVAFVERNDLDVPTVVVRRCRVVCGKESGDFVRNRLIAMAIAVVAIACHQDRQRSAGPRSELRDSAGIQIVENARPPDGSRLAWRIGPEPAVSIGVLDGEDPDMLFHATDATRLSDGRIVVVNRGTAELRVFDEFGTYLATWGGWGEGPGEFEDIMQIATLPGDSVIAWGLSADAAMHVFDAAGNFGRRFSPLKSESSLRTQWILPVSVMRDGSILASQQPDRVNSVAVELWNGEGRLRSSLGSHPAQVVQIIGNLLHHETFGRTLTREPWGDPAIISLSDRYEIKAYARDGTPARIVRRENMQHAPTDADLDAYVAGRAAAMPSYMLEAVEEQRRVFRSSPVAAYFPAFESTMADRVNHLWVEEYESPTGNRPARLWTVFDPEGRVLGHVETPRKLEIHQIGEDYILGRTRDELDVEYVQVWPLNRSGS